MPDAPENPPCQIWDDHEWEELRKALITYFENRHLSPAEDLADDVILRLLKILGRLFSAGPMGKELDNEILVGFYEKLSTGGSIAGDEKCSIDLRRYAFGVARHVRQEAEKAARRRLLWEAADDHHRDDSNAGPTAERAAHKTIFHEEADDLAEQCLQECLRGLPKERGLLLRYYQTDKKKDSVHHRKLADELSMTPNALDVAVHRARNKVRECVVSCMERELPGSSKVWCKKSGSPHLRGNV